MSPQARVLLVGQALPDIDIESTERIGCSDFVHLEVAPHAPVLAVLGDDALERIAPTSLPKLKHDARVLVLVPEACPYERLALWARSGPHEVIAPEGLAAHVHKRIRQGIGIRAMFTPDQWLPRAPERGSAAWTALEIVPSLDCAHDVAAWANRLEWTRNVLWDICKSAIDITPTAALFLHCYVQACQARRRGYTVEAIARNLGFRGGASFAHALGRRGLKLPKISG